MAGPMAHHETKQLEVHGRAQKATNDTCPRCGNQLSQAWLSEEPSCRICRFTDYSYVTAVVKSKGTRPMEHALKSQLVYRGNYPQVFSGVTLKVRSERRYPRTNGGVGNSGWSRMKDIPTCPFPFGSSRCGEDMGEASQTKQQRRRNQKPYICPDAHRISIVTDSEGKQWWK